MTPFRPDRARRGPDPLLGPKMLMFVIGAVLGLIGMATDRTWLVLVAAVVLAAGIAIRFIPRPQHTDGAVEDDDVLDDVDALDDEDLLDHEDLLDDEDLLDHEDLLDDEDLLHHEDLLDNDALDGDDARRSDRARDTGAGSPPPPPPRRRPPEP